MCCAGSLAALSACRPHPTLILQLEDMQGDLTRFAFKLYAMLGKAGVIGLQMPKNRVMRQQFGSYLKERRPGRSATEDAYTSARLTRSQVRASARRCTSARRECSTTERLMREWLTGRMRCRRRCIGRCRWFRIRPTMAWARACTAQRR